MKENSRKQKKGSLGKTAAGLESNQTRWEQGQKGNRDGHFHMFKRNDVFDQIENILIGM